MTRRVSGRTLTTDIEYNGGRERRGLETKKIFLSTGLRLTMVGIASILSIVLFSFYYAFWGREPPYLIQPNFASCDAGGSNCTRITEPKVRAYNHNYLLDFCRFYSNACGQPLWDWYCKQWGFSKAIGGDASLGVGASYIFGDGKYVPPDYVPQHPGDSGICTAEPNVVRCDSTKYIDCAT